jgi:hypothetical protein
VSSAETASMKLCATSMIRRRSKLSASAPETSEKSMIGSEVDACTSATMFTDCEMDVMSQAAPTAWISPPKLEARLAIQMVRKMSCLKGANGDMRFVTSDLFRLIVMWIASELLRYKPRNAMRQTLKLAIGPKGPARRLRDPCNLRR